MPFQIDNIIHSIKKILGTDKRSYMKTVICVQNVKQSTIPEGASRIFVQAGGGG